MRSFLLALLVVASTSTTATVQPTTPTSTDTTAPSNPILIYPHDGESTSESRPEFVWRRSTDSNSNTIIYTLYLNGVATHLGISNLGNSSSHSYVARIDDEQIRLLPTLMLPDGDYNWYVTASDLSGNTSYSTTWHFTIDSLAPHLAVSHIDIYHDLTLHSSHPEDFTDLNFDIIGPKAIDMTVLSEPWSTITLQILDSDNQLFSQTTWTVNGTGIAYPYLHLPLGVYTVLLSSFDHGGNTTALPDFTLTIRQAHLRIPIPALPGSSPSTGITIPYTPLSLLSLPATIAKVETRLSLPFIVFILLAVLIYILLIIVWKRRYNIVFLSQGGKPIRSATIYHSIPGSSYTSKQPNLYTLTPSDHGRLYIAHLGHFSTFTLNTDHLTYIFSLSAKRKLYTVVLG